MMSRPMPDQNKNTIFPYPNQNKNPEKNQTNGYSHKYTSGSYSSKPFVNYYKNDLIQNKQYTQPQQNETNENELNQNQTPLRYKGDSLLIPNEPYEQPTKKYQKNQYLHNIYQQQQQYSKTGISNQQQNMNQRNSYLKNEFIQNPYRSNQNQRNQYQQSENKCDNFSYPDRSEKQENEQSIVHQNNYKPGTYSSKPFVNYYRNEILKNDQYNQPQQQYKQSKQQFIQPQPQQYNQTQQQQHNQPKQYELPQQEYIQPRQQQYIQPQQQHEQPQYVTSKSQRDSLSILDEPIEQPTNIYQNQCTHNSYQQQQFSYTENQYQSIPYKQNNINSNPYKSNKNQPNQYQQTKFVQNPYNNVQFQSKSNENQQIENKNAYFPNLDQNKNQEQVNNQTNGYKLNYTPGEYSSKPFVNYYRNQILQSKQKEHQHQSNEINVNFTNGINTQNNYQNQNNNPTKNSDRLSI